MNVQRLHVELHGTEVGELVATRGRAQFRFHPSYWHLPDRPALGRWFEDGAQDEVYPGPPGGLPAFFANLEPEGALSNAIARAHDLGSGLLELLAAAGLDLPGAVRLIPEQPIAARALAVVRVSPSPTPAFSLAGVQLKYSMSLDKNDRLTIPLPGELTDWMLKVPPPERYAGLSENEAATMAWARRAGFNVPECRVIPPDLVEGIIEAPPRALLLVRRYDRADVPVHQEDLCQVFWLQPEQKYPLDPGERDPSDAETLERRKMGTTAEGIGLYAHRMLGPEAFEEYLRRLVFVIASGNGDAHLKNWSIVYPDRKRARWSPLYDQVSTLAWHDETLALPLLGIRNYAALHRSDLVRLATHVGFPTARAGEIVDDTLARLRDAWLGEPIYPSHHEARLRHHWSEGVPLLRAFAPLPRA